MREPRRKNNQLAGDRLHIKVGVLEVGIAEVHVGPALAVEVRPIKPRDAVVHCKRGMLRAGSGIVNLYAVNP